MELITVMAIMTILSGIAVPRIVAFIEYGALTTDLCNAKIVHNHMHTYREIHGNWPERKEDLKNQWGILREIPTPESAKSEFVLGKKRRLSR